MLQGPRGAGFLEAELAGNCELPDVGTVNPTWVYTRTVSSLSHRAITLRVPLCPCCLKKKKKKKKAKKEEKGREKSGCWTCLP